MRRARSGGAVWSARHRGLPALFAELEQQASIDDPRALRRLWGRFEGDLDAHMAQEERELLPAYRRVEPRDAREIAREHDDLRRRMAALGVDIDLHLARRQAIDSLLARLRAHVAHEERTLYRWAQQQQHPAPPAPRPLDETLLGQARRAVDELTLQAQLAWLDTRDGLRQLRRHGAQLRARLGHAAAARVRALPRRLLRRRDPLHRPA